MNIADFNTLVVCKTFNQSRFITDALNGFAMQKTDFSYVCLVIDDASTDGEQEVIRAFLNRECLMDKAEHFDHELADIVIAGHKTNSNCKFAVYFLKENLYNTDKKRPLVEEWQAHCEYTALCEGDDYWTDPLKLQRQVDYLNKHPEIDICAHSCLIINMQSGQTSYNSVENKELIIPAEEVIIGGGNFVGTATLFFRRSIDENLSKFREYLNMDYSIQIDGSIRGGMGYLPYCMSTYRYMVPDSWSSRTTDSPEYLSFLKAKKEMFSILDSEYNGRFHNAIMARMLKDEISMNGSGRKNRESLKKYSEGFRILPLKAKIRILMKCYTFDICNLLNIK